MAVFDSLYKHSPVAEEKNVGPKVGTSAKPGRTIGKQGIGKYMILHFEMNRNNLFFIQKREVAR